MKKLFLFFTILLFSVCAYATINKPVVTALNSTTYTVITIPQTNGGCRDICAWTETGVAFYTAIDSSGTGEQLIPAPGTYSYGCVTDTDGVVFYAKSVAGTPNLVVNYTKSK